MSRNFETLGLGLQGKNLNLICIRGFANLGLLAKFSSPDVMSQVENPLGTQRPLDVKHAREVSDYGLGSLQEDPNVDPRAFPEIMLNVRDLDVVYISQLDEGAYNGIDDYVYDKWGTTSTLIQIDIDKFSYPPRSYDPQISRIDGNHRLSVATSLLEMGYELEHFPIVPYSMFLGLNADQERKLFVDINGKIKKMAPGTTKTFQGTNNRNRDPRTFTQPELQNWIAHKMSATGGVFDGMVNMGGSLAGFASDDFGKRPPITINVVEAAVKHFYSGGKQFVDYQRDPHFVFQAISTFFELLKVYFPDEWVNKREYILLDNVGLCSFGKVAGNLAANWALTQDSDLGETFDNALDILSQKMPLDRKRFAGVVGAGGINTVYLKAIGILQSTRVLPLE
jgi:hypothetical protein